MSEKMKMKDFVAKCNEECLDIDVGVMHGEDWCICYSGDDTVKFTDYCLKKYDDVFECEIEVDWEGAWACIDDENDALNKLAHEFMLAYSGYVGTSEYDRLFEFED